MDDLRVADHEPLHEAHRNAANVLHAFVFDPFWFGRTSFGFAKTGHFRARFLLESLVDLRKSLASAGSSLIVRTGHTPDVLASLAASVGATAVYAHAEACSEELAIEAGVRKALKGKAELHTYWGGRTMYHPEDIPFKMERVPQVFTQFRRAVEAATKPRPPLPVPRMRVSSNLKFRQEAGGRRLPSQKLTFARTCPSLTRPALSSHPCFARLLQPSPKLDSAPGPAAGETPITFPLGLVPIIGANAGSGKLLSLEALGVPDVDSQVKALERECGSASLRIGCHMPSLLRGQLDGGSRRLPVTHSLSSRPIHAASDLHDAVRFACC